ncbi:olfactory receptor 5V1-like, partial [Tupaia chinensis]|uniref:olfactory receptor 5V1-like n=1 Tax=Tupaia chinensis TaxID=246437 RepID=UPI0003C902F7
HLLNCRILLMMPRGQKAALPKCILSSAGPRVDLSKPLHQSQKSKAFCESQCLTATAKIGPPDPRNLDSYLQDQGIQESPGAAVGEEDRRTQILAVLPQLVPWPVEMNNQTYVTEFILLGFSNHSNLQALFFLIFLVIYLTTLLGNMLIITATRVSPALHTPMYYFLSNLSFLDICYTSTTVPVMLVNFFREKKTISYEGCLSQVFFFVTCAGTECVLLAAMAYDRYVAICRPLQYPVLMSVTVCAYLVAGSWLCGLVNSMTHTGLTATLSLCGPNQISHFLCEVPLLLKLSCSDTSVNESVLYVASATIGLSPCLITVVSYILIISAILKIPSAQGRSKAFSTCASHLTVVIIFYGMANFNYDRPREGYSLDMDILVSVLFCIVTPMLNPIIYSLRNKEVKGALRKLAGRCVFPGNNSV